MRLLCQEEFYESENIFSAYVFCIPRRPVPGMRKMQEKRKKPRLAKASRQRTIFRRCGIIVSVLCAQSLRTAQCAQCTGGRNLGRNEYGCADAAKCGSTPTPAGTGFFYFPKNGEPRRDKLFRYMAGGFHYIFNHEYDRRPFI